MKYLAAADIGNSTTETCLAAQDDTGRLIFLSSASVFTTGVKGTPDNVPGVLNALELALEKAGLSMSQLDAIYLNEAAPVISGAAMETLTETAVTEASMLGHDPKTPAGFGVASGETRWAESLLKTINNEMENNKSNRLTFDNSTSYILVVPACHSYETISEAVNRAGEMGITILAAVLESDEAVLVYNRLRKKIPIVDEVKKPGRIPEGIPAAVEVAYPGRAVRMLSNPYGIATLLRLTPEETRAAVPIAQSLTGAKSAAVFKSGLRFSAEPAVKAGRLFFHADGKTHAVDIREGAAAIMALSDKLPRVENVTGEPGTQIGMMFERAAHSAQTLASNETARIQDVLAADIFAPVKIAGALSGETAPEKAVAVAAMVTAGRFPMERIAEALAARTRVFAKVSGVEAVMAALGALTTPGASLPLCVLDLGGGSTDAALLTPDGICRSVCLAGAGELVTLMIQTELGLPDRLTAEHIKRWPAVFCESLFHMRLENGQVLFTENRLEPKFFGRTALLAENGPLSIEADIPMEKLTRVRRDAKAAVFVTNALRALKKLCGGGEHLHTVRHVVLVGGSAEDFEIPEIVAAELAHYRIACGRGNIRGGEGARNAVATGLLMDHAG